MVIVLFGSGVWKVWYADTEFDRSNCRIGVEALVDLYSWLKVVEEECDNNDKKEQVEHTKKSRGKSFGSFELLSATNPIFGLGRD